MSFDDEKLIDEIANRAKLGRDISQWQNNDQFSYISNLILKLTRFPKAKLPQPELARVKNQILDRISVPAEAEISNRAGFLVSLPSILRLASGIAGTLLILISLGIGTAVVALQSVPGDAIYPLKKVVENIELRMTSDQTAKANLQIQFANNRLDELTEVLAKNQAGEISSQDTQKIVADTINDIQKTTAAALSSSANAANNPPKVNTLTKLVDLSNKQVAVLKPLLSAATIKNEGEVKIVLQKAIETSLTSKEEAIKNIENAGMKIDDEPIVMTKKNGVTANGKITTLTSDSISIGTAKFLLTNDTEYANIKSTDLKLDQTVEISGEVREDHKTYALKISLVDSSDTQTDAPKSDANSETKAPDTESKTDNTEPQ